IKQPQYLLPTTPAVKWLATQDRNINRELPYVDSATETPEEYVSRTYLQFLWLPQSIMPLQFLCHAIQRVVAPSPCPPSTSQPPAPAAHPLHALLQPILLTSRAASQKYHDRLSQLLAEENEPANDEEEYMCYAYQKDKTFEVDLQEEQDEDEVQERLKKLWLERMERREIQIQILLHFLLLTLPGNGAAPSADTQSESAKSLPLPPSLSPSKSKKRKRRAREKAEAPPPPPQPLEERLETYMDKLAMWQLMRSVDSTLGLGHADPTKSAANGQKKDDRDWMQAFCEDIVEPLFKEKLPGFCALFRSKLFQEEADTDTDTLDLSPPDSPKPATKRLKSSASTASVSAKAGSSKTKEEATQRARSRSLSMSLEQEQRERSRSVSIGPGGLRKRAIVREVSMTTVFKGKARAKSKAELARATSITGPTSSLSRTQSQRSQAQAKAKVAERAARGTVLVAATPVKPRTISQSQPQSSGTQARLPALFAASAQPQSHGSSQSRLARVDSLDIDADADAYATPTKTRRRTKTKRIRAGTDEEEAGDEWTLHSSPDVLLLGASGTPFADSPPASS
ncbi:DNA replication regulator SLD3-domain-containing protein, partial [Trametes elegans]